MSGAILTLAIVCLVVFIVGIFVIAIVDNVEDFNARYEANRIKKRKAERERNRTFKRLHSYLESYL